MANSNELWLDPLTRERDMEEGSEWVRVRRSSVAALSSRHHSGQNVLPAGVLSSSQLMQNRDKVEAERFEEALRPALRRGHGASSTPQNPYLSGPTVSGSLGAVERTHHIQSRPSLAEVASSMSRALSMYKALSDPLLLEGDLEEVNTELDREWDGTKISSGTVTSNPSLSYVPGRNLEEREGVGARLSSGTGKSNSVLSHATSMFKAHANPQTWEGDWKELLDKQESDLDPIRRNLGSATSNIHNSKQTSTSVAAKREDPLFQTSWFRKRTADTRKNAEIGEVDTEPREKLHRSGPAVDGRSSSADEKLKLVKLHPSFAGSASSRFEKASVSVDVGNKHSIGQTKDQICPIRSCSQHCFKPRKHVQVHFPIYFKQVYEISDHHLVKFVKFRAMGLRLIANFLLGEGSTLDKLVGFVNEKWKPGFYPSIFKPDFIQMDAMIAQESWPKVIPSLDPVNTPAALCHWRPLAFLFDCLTEQQREKLFLLGEKELKCVPHEEPDGHDFSVSVVGRERSPLSHNPDCSSSAKTKPVASQGSRGNFQFPGVQHLNPVKETNASSTTGGRSRKKYCPIRNCHFFAQKIKQHVLTHLPKYFRELHLYPESHWDTYVKVRVMGLRLIAKFLVGEGSTLNELVDFVNSKGKFNSPHISHSIKNEMDVMIAQQSWPKVVPSLEPINTPAALSHWRVLTFLFNQLSQLQKEILFMLEKTDLHQVTDMADKQAPERDPLPEKVDVRREPAMLPKTPPVLLRGFDAHYQPDLLHAKMQAKMQASGNDQSNKKVIPGREPNHIIQLEGGVKSYCDPVYFSTPHFEQMVLGGKQDSWRIAVGIPPKLALSYTPYQWDCFVRHLGHPKVKAISGIGLDFSVPRNQWNGQENLVERLLISGTMGHVLVLQLQGETRDYLGNVMYQHALHLVKQRCFSSQRIHLHCFSGSFAAVKNWTQAFPDCYFGISGLIRTFNREQLQALKEIPKNRLLLETNSPNGHVHPNQEYNTPDFLGDLGKLVADAMGVSLAEVMSVTLENGLRLYK